MKTVVVLLNIQLLFAAIYMLVAPEFPAIGDPGFWAPLVSLLTASAFIVHEAYLVVTGEGDKWRMLK